MSLSRSVTPLATDRQFVDSQVIGVAITLGQEAGVTKHAPGRNHAGEANVIDSIVTWRHAEIVASRIPGHG